MRKEIDKAVETFHRIALGSRKQGNKVVADGKLASFVTILTELLMTRYENNWYPTNPNRGSGYRCLRINGQCIDPTVVEGLKRAQIELNTLCGTELTVWVDPGVVSVRIGEEGSIGSEVIDEEVFLLTLQAKPPTIRKRAPSEDEAYSSRSPSPAKTPERPMSVSPPLNSPPAQINHPPPSADFSPRSLTSSPQVSSYMHYSQQRRMSPPRMMGKGVTPLSTHPANRGNISSGHIPSQSCFSPARALFPSHDNYNGSFHEAHLQDGVVNANFLARQAMPMHMNMTGMIQGNFHDIPISAMA